MITSVTALHVHGPAVDSNLVQKDPVIYGIPPTENDHAPEREPSGPLRGYQVAQVSTSASVGISDRYFTTGSSSDGYPTVWLK